MEKPKRWDVPFSREPLKTLPCQDVDDDALKTVLSTGPFRQMNPSNFPRHMSLEAILQNDAAVITCKKGDVIVRQGDYGNSAFLILKGSVGLISSGLDPALLGRGRSKSKSLWRSLLQPLTNHRSAEVRDSRLYRRSVSTTEQSHGEGTQDGGPEVLNILDAVPDALEKLVKLTMTDGELFGELAALGRMPRSDTIVACEDSQLLEVRWQGLREMRTYDVQLRQYVDGRFRRFGLASTLRSTPILAGLSPQDLDLVAKTAEFETYGSYDWHGTYADLRKQNVDPIAAEPIIAEQGHYPNGLILIRAGFARLSQRYGHGERTFNYLGTNDVYGLEELVDNIRSGTANSLRSTLRAIGYVDIVRIPTTTFESLILPHLNKMTSEASTKGPGGKPNELTIADFPGIKAAPQIDTAMLEGMVEQRLINGTAVMMIDMNRCTRCDDCVRACASGHDNNPVFLRQGTVLGHHMIAKACMHCVDPVCMIGCPTGAIRRSEDGGTVVVNDITCIGCGVCANACPYDNIRLVEIRDRWSDDALMVEPIRGRPLLKATKCDLCSDHHGGPACQRACPHDALKRVDMRDLDKLTG